MLSVENLTSAYGRIEVLHGVSIEVRVGEIVAIVGANGEGQDDVATRDLGVQPITTGGIFFSGKAIETLPAHVRVALGIVQVPEGRQLFAPLSVEDNLKLGSWSRRAVDLGSELARIYALFPVLGALRRLAAGTLSGGQQQMLAIGRALMAKPRFLLPARRRVRGRTGPAAPRASRSQRGRRHRPAIVRRRRPPGGWPAAGPGGNPGVGVGRGGQAALVGERLALPVVPVGGFVAGREGLRRVCSRRTASHLEDGRAGRAAHPPDPPGGGVGLPVAQRLGVQDRVADDGRQADRADVFDVLRHPATVAENRAGKTAHGPQTGARGTGIMEMSGSTRAASGRITPYSAK